MSIKYANDVPTTGHRASASEETIRHRMALIIDALADLFKAMHKFQHLGALGGWATWQTRRLWLPICRR